MIEGSLYPGMSTLEESEMTSNFAAGNCAFTVASAATMSQFTGVDFEATTIPVKDGYEGPERYLLRKLGCRYF